MKMDRFSRLGSVAMAAFILGVAGAAHAQGEDVQAQFARAHKLINEGKADQALPILETLRKKPEAVSETGLARVQDLYGVCLLNNGRTDDAIEAFSDGKEIYEGLKPSDREGYDGLLLNLSIAQRAAKRFEGAEKTLLKLLELVEEQRSTKPAWFVLGELAALHEEAGDLDRALTRIQAALDALHRSNSEDHESEARMYGALTDYLTRRGDVAASMRSGEKWVAAARRAYPPEDPNLAAALQSCGRALERVERIKEANDLFVEAMEIYRNASGGSSLPGETPVFMCMVSLAGTKLRLDQFREAEALLSESEQVLNRIPGNTMPLAGYWHDCCRRLYMVMNDPEKTLHHAEESLACYRKAYDEDSPMVKDARRTLALMYEKLGRQEEADRMGEGLDGTYANQDELRQIEGRGWNAFMEGDYAAAEKLFTELYQRVLREHGEDHPWVAAALFGLLNTCHATDQDEKGASIYARLGDFMKSHEDRLDSRIARDAYLGLAIMGHKLKKREEAKAWTTKYYLNHERQMNAVLSVGTHQQRLQFAASRDPYHLFATLNAPRALATVVLRLKGVVMDSLLEERRYALMSKDPKHKESITELARLKEDYRKLTFSRDPQAARDAEEIKARIEGVEQDIAGLGTSAGVTRRALRVKIEDVQGKLPDDSLLIEFIHYHDARRVLCYGAILIPPAGEVKWVPIGQGDELDSYLKGYKFIGNHFGNPAMMEASARKLHSILWEPVEKHFPKGTKRLILSPDSELCFVSFATLLNAGDEFLSERYDIQYVASGRDLLRQPYRDEMERSRKTMTIFADPEYLLDSSGGDGARWMAPLPGAREEGEALKAMAEGWGWKVDLFTAEQADEQTMRALQAPRILHLATHGFYLDDMPHPGKQSEQANPMLKSGLALAGAENTFKAWRSGKVNDPSRDGILMADELGDLDLRGSWLVCLSACQTGSGEAKSGQGVLGLRRGFVEAGAQHLISTLWPIPDDTTVPMMKDFYTELAINQDPPLALSRVQRDWLVRLRDKHESPGLAIIKAGAFITSSYGAP
ncbi:CHAT domain-containing protein [Haloferula sp. A504]|uniref:CHAT domain-containing protein n=1 Tax=Haloferula sp. A504 TaxID=3373601 RepID=UPI0031BC5040|nr:CHAT domain-containing protein [Verrucomicrobiaceae bacterium E54]